MQEKPQLFDKDKFLPLDPTQELIFPPELIVGLWLLWHTAKFHFNNLIHEVFYATVDGRGVQPTNTHFLWGEDDLGVPHLA